MESKIGPAALQSFPPREQAKTHGCLNPHATEPTTEPIDRPTSPSTALPQHPGGRVVGEDDHRAAAAASPPNAITPPLPQQSQGQGGSVSDKEDGKWEIVRIVTKRRRRGGDEYKVRWKSTWLPESELGNAQRLVREFEGRGWVQ